MPAPAGGFGLKWHKLLAALLIMASMIVLRGPSASAQGVVHLLYFYDPRCSSCEEVHREVLEPLIAKYGERLVVDERNIAEMADFELMLNLEMQFQVLASSIPEVFIGQDVLVGAEAIRAKLAERIEHYLTQGGVALPAVMVASASLAARPTQECDECGDIHAAAQAAAATRRAVEGKSVVRALLFWSETCPACHVAREEVLPAIVSKYGSTLELRAIEVTASENEKVWLATLKALNISEDRWYIPMVIVDNQFLIGSQEIRSRLPSLVDQYMARGGVDFPKVPGVSFGSYPLYTPPGAGPALPPLIWAAYFYQPGCDECDRAEHDLSYILTKYPQLRIERYNVREQLALNQYLSERAGVPVDKHLTAPAFFAGEAYLVGDQVRARAIEALITPYLQTGVAAPWIGWESQTEAIQQTIVERFRSFGIVTVVGAGLLDGVNPCAFATMIFLISYLSMRKRKGRALLATGAAFTLGVFLTYLGVGFGFLRFLAALPFLSAIGKWIYGATALLCLALAWGSIADYRKAKEGRLEDMSLKLPERLRGWSKTLIREGTGSKRFVLSAFALGVGVSIVELACTGQVYLPTIIYVLGVPELRAQASLALLLYNVMFVLPLIGVFLLVYFGTTSQQLIDWMTKHTAAIKLGTAALFVLLAGWLAYSVISL
jgi:cytochrome c biogenesis protein CcdA/thiol-disulfide isomerase/thioredoxin